MADFVLDASVALAAVLPGEPTTADAEATIAMMPAFVPTHWHLELGNTILVQTRRTRLPEAEALRIIARLRSLPVVLDDETPDRALTNSYQLAIRHKLTLYDAAYLELALRRTLPLATFDKALRRAAEAAGVAPVNPIA